MSPSLYLYPSDLSDREWEIFAPLIPPAQPGGRPRKWPTRKILNANFYLLRSGCQWRMLPRELPPWSTVHHYFRMWRLETAPGRRSMPRCAKGYAQAQGAIPQPSAAILDAQSVKTTSVGGLRGYDGAKKLSERKRHLLVDTLGMVLKARVHSAELQDRALRCRWCWRAAQEFPRLEHLWVDQGYTGTGKAWIEERLGWCIEVVKIRPKHAGNDNRAAISTTSQPSGLSGFGFRPNRRSSAARYLKALGSGANHRLAFSEQEDELRDYELLCETSQTITHAVMSRLMLRRLARA
jgi:putative transposase